MPKFTVEVYRSATYCENATFTIEAGSKEEAEAKAAAIVEEGETQDQPDFCWGRGDITDADSFELDRVRPA